MRKRLALGLVGALVLFGCYGPGRYSGEKDGPPSLVYETVWVDPIIVYSDSLITLIRSDRLDSLAVDPAKEINRRAPSLDIIIVEPTCITSVSLHHVTRGLIHPLMVQNLTAGFYRLTFSPSRFRAEPLLPGRYFLRADYCSQSLESDFVLD